MIKRTIFFALLIGIAWVPASFGAFDPERQTNLPNQAEVVQVIDGNTLYLSTGQRVVLIGVKPLPEKEAEATEFMKGLVLGKEVKLTYDVKQRDKFGRLLAYLFLPDDTFVNRAIIQEGLAEAQIESPNISFRRQLLSSEEAPPELMEGGEEILREQRQLTEWKEHTIKQINMILTALVITFVFAGAWALVRRQHR